MVQAVMRVLDRPEQLMIKFMNKSINVKQNTNKASAIIFTKNLLILLLSLLEICPANDGSAYVIFDKMRA